MITILRLTIWLKNPGCSDISENISPKIDVSDLSKSTILETDPPHGRVHFFSQNLPSLTLL